ncbi:MAG: hypothetical protein ACTHOJ_18095, partial [Sphingomonas oligoaromativorans]
FNGAGQFNRLYNWQSDAANGLDILAPRMDAEFDGIAAGLSNCITRDGQSPPTAAINWGGQNLLNVGTLTVATLNITGNEAVSGNVNATNATLTGTLSVAGASTMAAVTMASASISGNVTVGGTLGVTGATTIGGLLNGSSSIFSGNLQAANVFTTASGIVQAGTTPNGYGYLSTGSPTNTGHVAFYNAAGSRQGYVGNATTGGPIIYNSDTGGGHTFTGGSVSVSSANSNMSIVDTS